MPVKRQITSSLEAKHHLHELRYDSDIGMHPRVYKRKIERVVRLRFEQIKFLSDVIEDRIPIWFLSEIKNYFKTVLQHEKKMRDRSANSRRRSSEAYLQDNCRSHFTVNELTQAGIKKQICLKL